MFFFFYGYFCVCLLRKFMGLKAKVCFARDMGMGFGSLLEIDYREEYWGRTRRTCSSEKIMEAIKIKDKKYV